MYRGTTPNLYLDLETGLDLSQSKEIWVTIKSSLSVVNKQKSDLRIYPGEGIQQLIVTLTQEDTLALSTGRAKVQVRILMNNNRAYSTEIEEVDINQILRDGVITDESAT